MSALGITGPSHEAKRHALLRLVGVIAPNAVVFFDARQAPADLWDTRRELDVRVVYCREREADAFIIDRVREASDPHSLLVVSNDREVAGKAVQLGARARGVAEFFAGRPDRGANRAERDHAEEIRSRTWKRLHYRPEDFGLPDEVDLENPGDDLAPERRRKKNKRRRR